MHRLTLLMIVFCNISVSGEYTAKEVKCHVCKAVVQEIEDALSEVNPKKMVDVSGFRLDVNGNAITKSVPLVKSELYLSELMDKICDKMENYVKATYKKTGKFILLKIMVDGFMNPLASEVNFVQDEDLNKSLGHYCLEILDDQEEVFLKEFKADTLSENLDIKICSEETQYCDDAPVQEDYEFDKEL